MEIRRSGLLDNSHEVKPISNLDDKKQTKTIKTLLDNSYRGDDKLSVIDGYQMDPELSGNRAQVYYNNITGKAYVVHRGTQGIHDIATDVRLALGDKSSERFAHGRKIQKAAGLKYGPNNITTIGHSLGGSIAERVGGKSERVITLNKPVTPLDLYTTVKQNQQDIRASLDPVSLLRPYQKGKKAKVIESTTNNPLVEHRLSVMNRLLQ